MNLKMRTSEEMKAYVDGYNACNKQFRECLKNRKSVVDAVKKMDVFVAAVNGIINNELNPNKNGVKTELEPCDDCISRQEAINCVTLNEFRYKIVEDMKTLPSVAPKEKTGHWINKTLIYKSEAGSEYDCYTGTCSVCGETQECWNYCGGCGARMVSE